MEVSIVLLTVTGAVALAVSAVSVSAIRRYALRVRLVDVPNGRSSHATPTPRGGGLALVVITIGGLIISSIWVPELRTLQGAVALACFGGIALLSLIDDLRSVPYELRLLGHAAAAVFIVVSIGSIDAIELPWVGTVSLGWGGPLLTVLWIVGLTNAYNFMDGIDGIAGIQSIVAGAGLAALGLVVDAIAISLAGALLAGAAAGFLLHNWPPARIFMGDVGSAFAGLFVATVVTAGAQRDDRFALAGVLLVAPFVIDTTFTLVRRLLRGENVFRAHRSHLYQRLVIAGLEHRTVTIVFGVAAAIGLALAVLWLRRDVNVDILVLAYPLVLGVGLYVWARNREARWMRNRASPPSGEPSPTATSTQAAGP